MERIRDVYGDSVVIPYVMPGFDLARLCAERFAGGLAPRTLGMVLMNHGIFSFGETARESYERMIALVTKAEETVAAAGARERPAAAASGSSAPGRPEIATLRRDSRGRRGSRCCSPSTTTRAASPSRAARTSPRSRSRVRRRPTT